MCGNPILDFAALQGNARYDGGYHAEHKVTQPLPCCHSDVHQTPLSQPKAFMDVRTV